jgi:ABC-type proline/glycine betaine transport system permease subunit
MNALVMAIGIAVAGACIGEAINSLGRNIKAGLETLADAFREIEE